MELKEILKFADDTIYSKTGKHLNDLQADIIEESLRGNKYNIIAEKHNCTTDHVGKVAAELWGYLSDKLGEKIKKSNVRNRLENAIFTIISHSPYANNHLNYCNNGLNNTDIITQKKQNIATPYIDLDDAPCLNLFYGRSEELNNVQQWLCERKSRLINIFGLPGTTRQSQGIVTYSQ